jgi:hypothetical protein
VIACSLPPLIEMHAYYYDDGLSWLMMMIILLMYLPFTYACLLECSRIRLQLYSCIMNMAKRLK